jgi:hypothetical protein
VTVRYEMTFHAMPTPRGGAGAQARRWAEADGEHIDVRGLEPPRPLVAILQLVDSLGDAGVVIVHHDRDPMLLYPELAERGWVVHPLTAPPGEMRLRLSFERTPT